MDLVVKSPRYLTLLGDDITKKNILSQILSSNDPILASLSTAFMALADTQNPVETSMSVLKSNIIRILYNRLALERFALSEFSSSSFFIKKEALKNLSIDTSPTPEIIFESTRKYGPAIKHARLIYGIFLSADIAYTILPISVAYAIGEATPELLRSAITNIAEHTTSYSRRYNGLARFNQIAKEEWAIRTTPKEQEYKETSILPSVKQRDAAPA